MILVVQAISDEPFDVVRLDDTAQIQTTVPAVKGAPEVKNAFRVCNSVHSSCVTHSNLLGMVEDYDGDWKDD